MRLDKLARDLRNAFSGLIHGMFAAEAIRQVDVATQHAARGGIDAIFGAGAGGPDDGNRGHAELRGALSDPDAGLAPQRLRIQPPLASQDERSVPATVIESDRVQNQINAALERCAAEGHQAEGCASGGARAGD